MDQVNEKEKNHCKEKSVRRDRIQEA